MSASHHPRPRSDAREIPLLQAAQGQSEPQDQTSRKGHAEHQSRTGQKNRTGQKSLEAQKGQSPEAGRAPSQDRLSRRAFLHQTASGAAIAASAARVFGSEGQSSTIRSLHDRLRVAFVGVGVRAQAHMDRLLKLQRSEAGVEVVAVCDVYSKARQRAVEKIRQRTNREVLATSNWREILDAPDIDVLCVATPDHWHARLCIDALQAGKHVYCETPMTQTPGQAVEVLHAWRNSGCVMQVGVQRTSDSRWAAASDWITSGRIGKVLQAQSESYRNSATGQWRSLGLSRDMTPRNIDWPMYLGTEFGLAPQMAFDRAKFRQWRCYWPFGTGLYGDLFVPRLTQLLLALGVRYPRRVTSSGGIFLEYDGRDVPDTATVVADYDAGLQILLSATLGNDHPIEQCIRGHHGTLVFTLQKDGFDVLPQRPQVTGVGDAKRQHISAERPEDETTAHWQNFLQAIRQDDPSLCHNTPELGAAAVITVGLGLESYRRGKALGWDPFAEQAYDWSTQSEAYPNRWEKMSQARSTPEHVPGWQPEPTFSSRQTPPTSQKLAGPWPDFDTDPAG